MWRASASPPSDPSAGLGPEQVCDVLVVGSGAAGMATAVTAARAGLQVIVVERNELLGGTSAWSGGWLYVPGDPRSTQDVGDSRHEQLTYLRSLAGEFIDEARVAAFLDNVPKMLDFFEQQTDVAFVHPALAPDYLMDAPGAKPGGRSVYAAPLDARDLGRLRLRLRPYLKEITFFGVMPQIGHDLAHFLKANQSLRSLLYVCRRLVRQKYEEVRYGRGLQLSNGNALMARLVKTAEADDVAMHTCARVRSLTRSDGRVDGAVVEVAGRLVTIHASRGVVLACGGYSHDRASRRRLYSHLPTGDGHFSPMSSEHDGDALRLAEPVGGVLNSEVKEPAAWAPVTAFRGACGRVRVFPHLRGVGLPGIIAVDRHGQRFANEADSYHYFGPALRAANDGEADVYGFLVCDARVMHRYGLGYAKPWPNLRIGYRRSGYLLVGRTLEDLARRAGIDSAGLVRTVEEFNRNARRGDDPEFGRGSTLFNRFKGDASHKPNPSLGALDRAPFYATKIRLGDIGSFAGLATDDRARVVDRGGAPVEGLYAVGTAAASVFGGAYPGHGANLGPGLTFGFIAGRDVAVAQPSPTSPTHEVGGVA